MSESKATGLDEAGMAEVFGAIHARFPPERAPLLHSQLARYRDARPFAGITILHNVPVTLSTLLKLECLVAAGADVTVTEPVFVPSDPKAIAMLKRTGIRHIAKQADCAPAELWGEHGAPDLLLDCCAELAAHVTPRLGSIELTQTGEVRYKEMAEAGKLPYPVVSIDSSTIKRVEDALGSSDGFMRALRHVLPDDQPLTGRRWVVFGFGKCGLGICMRLSALGDDTHVTVVEGAPAAMERARAAGYDDVVAFDDVDAIKERLSKAWCAVTATGVSHLLAKSFGPDIFKPVTYRANIGASDEWGVGKDADVGKGYFEADEVLSAGMPINFVLEEPTTCAYLDPAFVSQNDSVGLFVAGAATHASLAPGVHALPEAINDAIMLEWTTAHPDEAPMLAKLQLQFVKPATAGDAGAGAAS